MLQPGLYEQVVKEEIGGELDALPPQRRATAAIDKAEASQVLAQYLAEVAQKGLEDLADKGGDTTTEMRQPSAGTRFRSIIKLTTIS